MARVIELRPVCGRGAQVHPKWAPRPLRRRMRYALIAFCEFMLREVRDEAARVAAGRPPAGPRACDGIRAAEAEGAAAAAPAPPAPQADKEHGKEGGGRRAAISLSAAAASTGGAGGDAPGPAPLKRSVTFAAGTRDAAGAVKGRPATAGHRRVRSITALCLVDGALGGGAPGGGDVLRAHSAPRLGRAASLPAQ